jgi:hypothetical protein
LLLLLLLLPFPPPFAGAPTVSLRVWTPPAVLQLSAPEKAALAQMATECCQGTDNATNSLFCTIM